MTYASELGYRASFALTGVDLISDGIVTSVEDMITENTYQYKARDLVVFHQDESLEFDHFPTVEEASTALTTTEDGVSVVKSSGLRNSKDRWKFA